jgi:hypothetical protein
MNLSGSIPFMKNQNKSRLYRGLWSNRSMGHKSKDQQGADRLVQSIDELCISADLCTDLVNYVHTLCQGMEDLLGIEGSQKHLKSHMALEDKVKRIGRDIMEQGYFESDLFYIGVFADFKLRESWLDKQVYQVLKNLIFFVLERGGKISKGLKSKIVSRFKNSFPRRYKEIFTESRYDKNLDLQYRIPI